MGSRGKRRCLWTVSDCLYHLVFRWIRADATIDEEIKLYKLGSWNVYGFGHFCYTSYADFQKTCASEEGTQSESVDGWRGFCFG